MSSDRAILDIASRFREDFLFRIYRAGKEFHRARQPGYLDAHAQAHRRGRSRAREGAGRAGAAAAARWRAAAKPRAAFGRGATCR